MDDFFLPPLAESPPIRIPWLVDSLGDIKGLQYDEVKSKQCTETELASWAQHHIFFSILEDILGLDESSRYKFASNDDDLNVKSVFIDHIECHRLITGWKVKTFDSVRLRRNAKTSDFIRLERKVAKVNAIKDRLEVYYKRTESIEMLECTAIDDDRALSKVALSIKVLLVTFYAILENIIPDESLPPIEISDGLLCRGVSRQPYSHQSLTSQVLDERVPWHSTVIPAGARELSRSASLLVDTLIEKGCCYAQAIRLCSRFGIMTVNYLCRVSRMIPEHISHKDCPAEQCIAYSMGHNPAKLRHDGHPKHLERQCDNERTSDISQKVRELVASGNIPLIRLNVHMAKGASMSDLSLKVERMKPWSSYVAISHLWVDGWGSTTDNTLCHCRLRKIAEYLKQFRNRLGFANSVLFWMDTFCIPTKSDPEGEFDRLRYTAIGKMPTVYAGARSVLVLDSELIALGPGKQGGVHQSNAHLAARLILSGWMTRSWTLLEGQLAQSLHVTTGAGAETIFHRRSKAVAEWESWSEAPCITRQQHGSPYAESVRFGDEAYEVPITSPLVTVSIRHTDDFVRHLARILQLRNSRLGWSMWKKESISDYQRFRLTQFVLGWNALAARDTTQSEDRHAIFANLVDLSAPAILRIPNTDSRLPEIIKSYQTLPLSLLYNTGPRMSTQNGHNDSWIPTEISDVHMVARSYIQRGNEGFAVHFAAFDKESPTAYLIDGPRSSDLQYFRVRDKDAVPESVVIVERCNTTYREYVARPCRSERTDQACRFQQVRPLASEAQHTADNQSLLHKHILILDPVTGSNSIYGFLCRGAELCCEGSDDDGTYFATYVGPLQFWLLDQYARHFYNQNVEGPIIDARDIAQDSRIIMRYGHSTRSCQSTFSIAKLVTANESFTNAPAAAIPRRPVLSRRDWRYSVYWTIKLTTQLFALFLSLVVTERLWQHIPHYIPHHISHLKLIKLLTYPIPAIVLLTCLTYGWAKLVNSYRRVVWLLTFEEDWHYVPSFLASWEIILDFAVVVLLAGIVVVTFYFDWRSQEGSGEVRPT